MCVICVPNSRFYFNGLSKFWVVWIYPCWILKVNKYQNLPIHLAMSVASLTSHTRPLTSQKVSPFTFTTLHLHPQLSSHKPCSSNSVTMDAKSSNPKLHSNAQSRESQTHPYGIKRTVQGSSLLLSHPSPWTTTWSNARTTFLSLSVSPKYI